MRDLSKKMPVNAIWDLAREKSQIAKESSNKFIKSSDSAKYREVGVEHREYASRMFAKGNSKGE